MATPTIAELQVNINSKPITDGTTALNNFADAAGKAKRAADGFNQGAAGGQGGGLAPEQETRKVKNLSEAIDQQTRKLNALAEQRRKLEASGIKSTQPQEYERLNRIIDANIARVGLQGDAVDRLERSQQRIAEQKAARARQEERLQERLTNATITQENAITAAAARQARSIDQTISGLSRQIKAQLEYNRTIEQLNRARDIGATSGGPGGISNGEYESYVKLAEARRDAAFATEDNTSKLAAAQSRLDTYIATLGRAERAEVQYSRAVATLQDNLAKGNITQDQYNTRIEQFAARRDQLVAAANSNAAAEERYARQLNQVLGAYDPVVRATNQYNAALKVLESGLESGSISSEEFTRALKQQRDALDAVKNANSSTTKISEEYEQALNSAIRYRTELQNLDEAQRRLDAARGAGLVRTDSQKAEYQAATAAIAENRREIEKRIDAGKRNSITIGQEKAALRGLPAQFTDIVVSLQGGQAPLTVLLQQGGQIKDMFGGVGEALRATTGYVVGLITPMTVLASAVALAGVAAYQGSEELAAFNKALITSAGASGASANSFAQAREELDDIVGTSGKAAAALTQMASGGRIAEDQFVGIAEAAIKMERATGAALDETIKDFEAIGKEPVEAAVRLDEKYRFLTASVLAQAQALKDQGREQEAVTLLQGELQTAVVTAADKMIEQAGYIERAWRGVKDIVSETWDALKSIGRGDTTYEQIARKEAELAALRKQQSGNEGNANRLRALGIDVSDGRAAALEKEITQLKQRAQYEDYMAKQQAENERIRKEGVDAQNAAQRRYQSGLKGVEKAQDSLNDVERENAKIRAAGNVTAEQEIIMTANLKKAQDDLAKAKEKAGKTKVTALDTTDVQEVRSNLALINAEYDGHYKRITALGESNVVSAEATFRSQIAILSAQREAVSKLYDEQISAINKLQENKKNSAAQNVSLDNQETKAEEQKARALEQIDAKMDVLQNKELGRIAERTRNVAAYKAALDSQLDSLVEQGARAADGVGRGDRQAALDQQLGQLDRRFNRERLELSRQAGTMDTTEFDQKIKALTENHTEMKDQILTNDAEIKAANYDWTNGFTSALENAEDRALNFADTTRSALEGAFNASGQALATFVTTGKFGFKDFASSVIADMARIAAQQAASGILSSILRFGVTAASAYFGGSGTGNGLTPGSAGYTSSNLGASAAGYSSQYGFAKGGAFTGGTQYFANGGTFTNSVVSSPTPFSMSEGRKGIMGESGPEAIVPLARTRNGDLGIRADLGGGSTGGNMTVVNVNVQVNKDGNTSSSDGGQGYDQFGASLGAFVRQEIYTVINTETRPGGSLQTQG